MSLSCPHVQALVERRPELLTVIETCVVRFEQAARQGGDLGHVPPAGSLVCLTCAEVAPSRSAASHHAQKCGYDHGLLFDFDQLAAYCTECKEYVLCRGVERHVMGGRLLAVGRSDKAPASSMIAPVKSDPSSPSRAGAVSAGGGGGGAAQRRAAPHPPIGHAERLARPQGHPVAPLGLRGLFNLGNTCFMNSVLQCVMQVPWVKHYFLGGGHMKEQCPVGLAAAAAVAAAAEANGANGNGSALAAYGGGANGGPYTNGHNGAHVDHNAPPCLGCQLDSLFTALYSTAPSPFSPSAFLTSWWRAAPSLVGGGQQDAHEFYLSLLEGLGGCLVGPPVEEGALEVDVDAEDGSGDAPSSSGGDPSPSLSRRRSISQHVFGGLLRSDVTCCICGYTSTAHDPFLDVSLDIEGVPMSAAPSAPLQQRTGLKSGPGGANMGRSGATGTGIPPANGTAAAAAAEGAAASADDRAGTGAAAAAAGSGEGERGGTGQIPGTAPLSSATFGVTGPDQDLDQEGLEPSTQAPSVSNRDLMGSQLAAATPRLGGPNGEPEPPDPAADAAEVAGPRGARQGTATGDEEDESACSGPNKVHAPSDSAWDHGGASYGNAPRHKKPRRSPVATPDPDEEEGEAGGEEEEAGGAAAPQGTAGVEGSRVDGGVACSGGGTGADGPIRLGARPAAPPGFELPASKQPGVSTEAGVSEPPRRSPPPPRPEPPTNRAGAASLEACLERFVRRERLGPAERWTCDRCRCRQEAEKQLSIRHLPPVLCIHLKRFKHNLARGIVRKLDTAVTFPLKGLDMAPFTTGAVLRGRVAECGRTGNAAELPPPPRGPALYDLLGFVSHSGAMDGGHYVAYLNCEGRWYRCDDSKVQLVDPRRVARVEAYLLLYVARA